MGGIYACENVNVSVIILFCLSVCPPLLDLLSDYSHLYVTSQAEQNTLVQNLNVTTSPHTNKFVVRGVANVHHDNQQVRAVMNSQVIPDRF